MLLGLKSDLRTNPRCIDMLSAQGLTPVTTAQGLAVAAKMGATYMECSARTNSGVREIFDKAVTIAVGDDYAGYKQLEAKTAKAVQRGELGVGQGLPKKKKKKSRSCKIF